jgi:murein DD-endopeptidase MepM/ murein hydrolase activator NlpD
VWLQWAVVGIFALSWWRGETLLADLTRQGENIADAALTARKAATAVQASLGLATVEVIVGANDTLERIFRRLQLSLTDLATLRALPEVRKQLDRLRPGELITFNVQNMKLMGFERKLSPSETLQVTREAKGFDTQVIVNPLEREVLAVEGVIDTSLFNATAAAGLDDRVALRIADIFQWDIDFVLEVQPGDRFRVVYERLSQDGEYLGAGEVLAAEFINGGKTYRAVRHRLASGIEGYYTPEGKSLRKAFIRAPLDFTRVSSRFNLFRVHPVLNSIRAHRGVDYAAPIGTPVKASGAGRVSFVGQKGGYGNVIEIEHANRVRTLYGHLSRFAGGLRAGERIEQGRVIGYVGMTGLATGPHLHYEYIVNGTHRDPQKVVLPEQPALSGAALADFRLAARPLLTQLDSATNPKTAAGPTVARSGGRL